MEMEQILTVEEVAVKLRLHPLTVRKLAREGSIPAFKVGRQWRFSVKEMNAWISGKAEPDGAISVEPDEPGEPGEPDKPAPAKERKPRERKPSLGRPDAPRITDAQTDFDPDL